VAFSLSLSTEGEITFVGGSLSVSAFEVTSRYGETEKERERERKRDRERSGDGKKGRETFSLSLSRDTSPYNSRAPDFSSRLVFLI